jgi:hypothetical protein
MLYPFFSCVICRNRVQLAVYCIPGELPSGGCLERGSRSSTLFEEEAVFSQHCRGQGTRFSVWNRVTHSPHDDSSLIHYNFTGCYSGMCCFCALKVGFSADIFGQVGCRHCVRKELLRAEVARCFGSAGGSWTSHGWRALPSAIVDRILVFVLGVDGRGVAVDDGDVAIARVV